MRAVRGTRPFHSGMVSPPKSERDRHKSEGTRPFHSSTVSPPKSERDRDANVLQVILPRSAHICRTCWRRNDRAASRLSTKQESEAASLLLTDSIVLPHFA
ncbi:hypothetical protein EVAR_77478_1 [Eumeta japonica]|uniref:Uncharacterized protein n=1 Tax=Eumeta variegata TaxID=151549 RepID=A0A4C1T9Q5_EUMVA|nr:hypothetical protein EVAR_77478_1 [Eumeta japonica]